ncbi:MAG: hypothetical protein IJG52_06930 [Lachnospiraceae bacterium]|nr:hypothetical protein [Lachnospiraceae bacterium]
MKNKAAAMILGISLSVMMAATGCAGSTGTADTGVQQESAEETQSSGSEEAAAESAEETAQADAAEASEADASDTEAAAADTEQGTAQQGEKPDGEPPEMPDGEMPEGGPGGPGGERPDGEPPAKPGESSSEADGQSGTPGGAPGGSQSSAPTSYDAATEYSADSQDSGLTIQSTGTDENAVLVSGGTVTLDDMTITRTSSDSTGGDSSSFYGVGAAVLATDGTLNISGSEISTDAAGGAGVFAYGDSTIYVSDTTITTQQDTSGGIHAAGGGTLYATNVTATTQGESSAAIRSDRGGGTMVVEGGSYTSNGTGSPAVYCTADITVSDAVLTATNSEAICIEGLNSLYLEDCDLTGNMPENEQNDCTWNVILYQSMSGDAEEGNSTFAMDGGTLTAQNGGMFYTTNTESTIILEDVDITYSKDSAFFLKCTGNSNARGWGSTGANGADCLFTAIDQDMEGDVIWDSISTLDFYMTEGSVLTGAVIDDESCAGEGGEGTCSLYISSDSKWVVTGDSVLTALYSEGTIVDESGKTVTIAGSDGTVYVQGDSSYTITVDTYEDTVDLSGASVMPEKE